MDRKLLITIHMYLAAFFTPAVSLVAISGGLYLAGIKGEVEQNTVYSSADIRIDSKSNSLKTDVAMLLRTAGVKDYDFEYVKVKDSTLYTRPTSAEHYVITTTANGVEVAHAKPDLQGRMMELHKGHGPTAFKTFQKAFAVGLLFIMLSGLWLGLSAKRLRRSALLTALAGTTVFILLVL